MRFELYRVTMITYMDPAPVSALYRWLEIGLLFADNVGPSTGNRKSSSGVGSGKKTIRLRSNGPATVEEVSGFNY